MVAFIDNICGERFALAAGQLRQMITLGNRCMRSGTDRVDVVAGAEVVDGSDARDDETAYIGAAAVALRGDDLRDSNDAVSKITVEGARNPAHLQQMVGH